MRLADRWWPDVRFAARSLRRTPALTATAIVTLALGIGATTTIFSMIQAVVRPLTIAAPDRLFFVAHGTTEPLSPSSHYRWFERVQREHDVFEGVAAYNVRDFKVAAVVLLAVTALAASYLPARRAARVDPATTLRND